jgi:hypothetical protein
VPRLSLKAISYSDEETREGDRVFRFLVNDAIASDGIAISMSPLSTLSSEERTEGRSTHLLATYKRRERQSN